MTTLNRCVVFVYTRGFPIQKSTNSVNQMIVILYNI